MGTDIHIHIEYRSRKSKQMKYGGEVYGARLYGMFKVMALEYDLPPLFHLRGLPGDVTAQTIKEYRDWGADAHSASWLSTIEFAACIVEANIRFSEECYIGWTKPYEDILEMMLNYENVGEACRLVFWFDN